ncbi:hypothetical protein AAFF_G00017180 [Aldrovandia affinis]|uniref:Uncharacterized protein n=1 Tax=Aldrovandia affinis TaxID=143900 RepID=A0AAD7R2Q4_9TELE|nr:hypothetical protein AAFF_G00017180 [Aldrovandia affinis]
MGLPRFRVLVPALLLRIWALSRALRLLRCRVRVLALLLLQDQLLVLAWLLPRSRVLSLALPRALSRPQTQFLFQFRPHHQAARALTVVDPPPVPAPRTRVGGGAVEEMADLAASPELFSPLPGSEAAVLVEEAPLLSVEGEAMPTSVDLLTPMDWGDSIQPSSPVERVGAEWARVAIRSGPRRGDRLP